MSEDVVAKVKAALVDFYSGKNKGFLNSPVDEWLSYFLATQEEVEKAETELIAARIRIEQLVAAMAGHTILKNEDYVNLIDRFDTVRVKLSRIEAAARGVKDRYAALHPMSDLAEALQNLGLAKSIERLNAALEGK